MDISKKPPRFADIPKPSEQDPRPWRGDEKAFLRSRGGYRRLLSFQKATCVLDLTFAFISRFIPPHDRLADQMFHAARSGRQNIAEGSATSTTSRESELRLTNVAQASLQELLLDYEDFLRERGLALWPPEDARAQTVLANCKKHNEADYYLRLANDPRRSAEAVANIAITLIHQTDYLLRRQIARLKQDFLEHGGIREEMARARRAHRGYGAPPQYTPR